MAWSGTLPPSLFGEDHGCCISCSEEDDDVLFSAPLASELQPQGELRRARPRRTKTNPTTATGDGDAKKRRLSDDQVKFLETCFGEEKKLELGRKVRLAAEAGLDPKQVAVWFQNRRSRHKKKQLGDSYLELKSVHDATILQKSHLENEVLMLKSKLMEAEEKISKLSLGVNGGDMAGSPSSSFLTNQPLMADFVEAELLALQEYDDFDKQMMEWSFLDGL